MVSPSNAFPLKDLSLTRQGLQCHTAPFSWKIIFECDYELYEIILTACSSTEADEWCARLKRKTRDGVESSESSLFSSQDLNMKSLGTIYGKKGTIARRVSIHRAITVTPKTPMCQVVVKNTSAVRDRLGNSSSTLAINRSQSLLTTNTRIPVLAPARAERARLELLLSDVWSREILPFPGITNRPRNEHLVRASSVMRKISIASLTGPFHKRTGSVSRRGAMPCEDELAESAQIAVPCHGEDCITSKEPLPQAPGTVDADVDATIKAKRPRVQGAVTSPAELPTKSRQSQADTIRLVKPEADLEKLHPKTMRALRKTSTNSICLVPSSVSVKAPPSPIEKENMYKSVDVKPTSRWQKVGRSKGVDKANGFRNFFR